VIALARLQVDILAVVEQVGVRLAVAGQHLADAAILAVDLDIDHVDQRVVRVDHPVRLQAVVAQLRIQPVAAAQQVDPGCRLEPRQHGRQAGGIDRIGLAVVDKQAAGLGQIDAGI
jgi:hypothetical protein